MRTTAGNLLERLAKISNDLVPELAFEAGYTYEKSASHDALQEWENVMQEVEQYLQQRKK